MVEQQRSPLISVVIPTFNRANVLPRAAASVMAQTYTDWELIVVDDGSTDDTLQIVRGFTDPRVRYVRQENRGRSAARNAGAAAAIGQFITFLDSDDEALPEWLQKLSETTKGDDIGIVCGGVRLVSDSGTVVGEVLPHPMGALHQDARGVFLAGSFATRRDLFVSAGGYAEGMSHSENTELALRLVPLCVDLGLVIAAVDEALVVYYMRDDIRNAATLEAQFAGSLYILQQHGARIRSSNPHEYANRCSVVGVSAARLGDYAQARRYLGLAVRADPMNWRYHARLALATVPFLGRRVWNRDRTVERRRHERNECKGKSKSGDVDQP